MLYYQLSNGYDMRMEQGSGALRNSAANPLPAAYNRAEFRCRPRRRNWRQATDIMKLVAFRGRLWSAKSDFFPVGRGMPDGVSHDLAADTKLQERLDLTGTKKAAAEDRYRKPVPISARSFKNHSPLG